MQFSVRFRTRLRCTTGPASSVTAGLPPARMRLVPAAPVMLSSTHTLLVSGSWPACKRRHCRRAPFLDCSLRPRVSSLRGSGTPNRSGPAVVGWKVNSTWARR
ncbi:MAG: hypothetical protein ACYTGW_16365 [Planctomycetota bacterium]